MTQVCHECGTSIYNPFYTLSAVLFDRETKRIAFSNLETTVCRSDIGTIDGEFKEKPEEMDSSLGIAVDGATGMLGGLTGAVQICTGYERHLRFKYVGRAAAFRKFPRSAEDLLNRPQHWVARTEDGGWTEAPWAQELYEKLSRE